MASLPLSRRSRLLTLIAVAAALAIAVYATRPTTQTIAPPPPAPIIAAPLAPPSPVEPPPPPPPPTPPQRGNIPGFSVNATSATRSGGGSISVTRPDGSHAVIATGTDALPGVRLIAVATDRATFDTGGTRFWLPILSESAAKADPAPATNIVAAALTPSPAPASATDAQRRESLAYQAALAPSVDGPYRGYAVRGQTPLFAKAGLKPGDVITGVNGRAFADPSEIAALAREASLSETLVFTIRRDGRSQELRVTPR